MTELEKEKYLKDQLDKSSSAKIFAKRILIPGGCSGCRVSFSGTELVSFSKFYISVYDTKGRLNLLRFNRKRPVSSPVLSAGPDETGAFMVKQLMKGLDSGASVGFSVESMKDFLKVNLGDSDVGHSMLVIPIT
jgi:hypothetical protein